MQRSRYKKALNKVTMFLHLLQAEGVDADAHRAATAGKSHADLPPHSRKISNYAATRFLPAKLPIPAIIATLSSATTATDGRSEHCLDMTAKKPCTQCDAALRQANVRKPITIENNLSALLAPYKKNYPQTAWDIYRSIPTPKGLNAHGTNDKHTKARWALYNLYTAHDGETIRDIIAIQQATDRTAHTTQLMKSSYVWSPHSSLPSLSSYPS
jgi:hypothetical protein